MLSIGTGAWRKWVRQYFRLDSSAVASAEGNFNSDGRDDLAAVAPDGSIHLLMNPTTREATNGFALR